MAKKGSTADPNLTPDQVQQLQQLKGMPSVPDLSGLTSAGKGLGLPNAPVGVGTYAPPGGNTAQPASPQASPYKPPAAGKDPAAAAPTAATSTAPSFDPLALQQMWASVFGPIFAQTAKIAGNAGPDYLNAMTQAISGSHQSPQAQGTEMSNARAMSDLLQTYAGNSLQQVSTGPTFDALINWLQQATGAAQLAQGAAEKNVAYGGALQNAAALGVPSAQSALSSSQLSPQQAAALTQSALGGTQTGTVAGTTGTTGAGATGTALAGTQPNNPFLPQSLLQAQGLP